VKGSDVKYRVIRPLRESVVNPLLSLVWGLRIPPSGEMLLETTGRRSGEPLRTPVCDGLEGETFWLVCLPARMPLRLGAKHRGRLSRAGRSGQRVAIQLAKRTARLRGGGTSLLTVRIGLDPH
jgi:hypothetical protein